MVRSLEEKEKVITYQFLSRSDSELATKTMLLIETVFNIKLRTQLPFVLNHLSDSNNSTVVAVDSNNDVIATASINYLRLPFENLNQGYISYVCCYKNYRRRGITTRLLEMLEQDARNHGCSHIFLDTNKKGRRAAHKMYKKLGFVSKEHFFMKEL